MDIGCRAIGYLFLGEKGPTLPTYPPSLQLLLLTFQPNPDTRPANPQCCPISNRNHCPICPGIGVRFGLDSVSEMNWNRCPNWPGVRKWSRVAEVGISLQGRRWSDPDGIGQ